MAGDYYMLLSLCSTMFYHLSQIHKLCKLMGGYLETSDDTSG